MSAGVILFKNIVAEYCKKSNRHHQQTMHVTFFLFCSGGLRKKYQLVCITALFKEML